MVIFIGFGSRKTRSLLRLLLLLSAVLGACNYLGFRTRTHDAANDSDELTDITDSQQDEDLEPDPGRDVMDTTNDVNMDSSSDTGTFDIYDALDGGDLPLPTCFESPTPLGDEINAQYSNSDIRDAVFTGSDPFTVSADLRLNVSMTTHDSVIFLGTCPEDSSAVALVANPDTSALFQLDLSMVAAESLWNAEVPYLPAYFPQVSNGLFREFRYLLIGRTLRSGSPVDLGPTAERRTARPRTS